MRKLMVAAAAVAFLSVGSVAFADEVTGALGNITSTSVSVGGKTIQTSGATQKPRAALENGQNVKVTFTTTNGVNRASKIEVVP